MEASRGVRHGRGLGRRGKREYSMLAYLYANLMQVLKVMLSSLPCAISAHSLLCCAPTSHGDLLKALVSISSASTVPKLVVAFLLLASSQMDQGFPLFQ